MVGQGDQGVIDQVRRLPSNLIRGIILAGHHDFSGLFADLFKDLVIPAGEEFAGVRVGVGIVAAIADYPKDLGNRICRGRRFAPINLVEAAPFAGVAGNVADLFHGDQECIAVAVVAQGLDLLGVARGFALVPEGGARSAPKPSLPSIQGFLQGLGVHPGHHQDGAVEVVLDDRWDESLVVVLDLVNGELEDCHVIARWIASGSL